jgi:hypothetical protein
VGERVEKVDDVGSSRMRRGCVGYLTKQLDFIPSRFRIPSGGLDDLQGGMTSLSVISALEVGGSVEMYDEHVQRVFHEPDGGKMAPSEGEIYEANVRAMEGRELTQASVRQYIDHL